MSRTNPTIVAVAETRLTADIEDCEVNVPGYSMVRYDDENKNIGGMIVHMKNNIRHETVMTKKD